MKRSVCGSGRVSDIAATLVRAAHGCHGAILRAGAAVICGDVIPELFDPVEEACAVGVAVIAGEVAEFLQQFLLAVAQIARSFHKQLDDHVATIATAQAGQRIDT